MTAFGWGEALRPILTHPSITADARMPAYCAVYGWLQIVPGLAEKYGDACIWRACHLEAERDRAIEGVWAIGVPAANAALRQIDGRIGRLRPKTYRFAGDRSA